MDSARVRVVESVTRHHELHGNRYRVIPAALNRSAGALSADVNRGLPSVGRGGPTARRTAGPDADGGTRDSIRRPDDATAVAGPAAAPVALRCAGPGLSRRSR